MKKTFEFSADDEKYMLTAMHVARYMCRKMWISKKMEPMDRRWRSTSLSVRSVQERSIAQMMQRQHFAVIVEHPQCCRAGCGVREDRIILFHLR